MIDPKKGDITTKLSLRQLKNKLKKGTLIIDNETNESLTAKDLEKMAKEKYDVIIEQKIKLTQKPQKEIKTEKTKAELREIKPAVGG